MTLVVTEVVDEVKGCTTPSDFGWCAELDAAYRAEGAAGRPQAVPGPV